MDQASDSPLLGRAACDLGKLIHLTRTVKLKNDDLIGLKSFYDELALCLTASIKGGAPVLPDFHQLDPAQPFKEALVPPTHNANHASAGQNYLIMARALAKLIPEAITKVAAPLAYKAIQQCLTEDDGWIMLEHLLQRRAPHLGGQANDLQKQIYDLKIIPGEDLDAYFNRATLLQKNITLSHQQVAPNLLFAQVLSELMTCTGFAPFLGAKYSDFLHFQRANGRDILYESESLGSIFDYLETSKAPSVLTSEHPTSTPSAPHRAPFIATQECPAPFVSPLPFPSSPDPSATAQQAIVQAWADHCEAGADN
jgi:hypothetical protein